jgi:hypothetical protein
MLTHFIASAAVAFGSVDPATIGERDITESMAAISEAILSAHHPTRHWDPRKMPSGESTRQHLGGYTALATLALLTAGHDAQSSPLREAIDYLKTIEPDGTYAVAFRAQVWASLPDRFLPHLQRDVDRLIESFHWEQGGWDYLCRPVNRIPRVSPSTRHVAILALHAASGRGIEVPPNLLKRVEAATIISQQESGGWSYHAGDTATGSMTAAGVFSLVLVDELLNPRHRQDRRSRQRNECLQRGLAWLDDRFEASPCPGLGRCEKYPMYWLYSLERMALATGTRRLAGRDWLRESTAIILDRLCTKDDSGRWITKKGRSHWQLRKRCFALMFLHRGRLPLACSHLRLEPGSIASDVGSGLVSSLLTHHEQETSWQWVDLNDPVQAWLESPMLLITGANEPDFIRTHRRSIAAHLREPCSTPRPDIAAVNAITDYVRRGGLLVAVTTGSGFTRAIKQIGSLAAPHASWHRLGRDHPAASLLTPPRRLPRLEALSTPQRDLIVLIGGPSEHVMPNLWGIATERHDFPPRLELSRKLKTASVSGPQRTVVFASDPDDCVEHAAADAFATWCERTGRAAKIATAGLPSYGENGLLVLQTALHQPEWSLVWRALSEGRVVLITGQTDRVHADASNAGLILKPVRTAPWVTAANLPGCEDLSTPGWRASTRQRGLATAGLDLIAADHPGGGTLILAPSDICHALLDRPHWGIHGYDATTARHLLWNLATWSSAYPAGKEPTHAAMDMVDDHTGRDGGAADRPVAVAATHGDSVD